MLTGCANNPVSAVSGVATFSGCQINKSGSGYTITFSSGALKSVTSNAFTISN
jgi:hypothetical protein